MSLRHEQYRALLKARALLTSIILSKHRLKKKELKEEAHGAMRHFPPLMDDGRPIFSQDYLDKTDQRRD